MVPQPQSPSLIIRGATIVTMNDAFDVIEGDVVVRDGRITAIGPSTDRDGGSHDQRARVVSPARFHPDAHPSVSDALSRLCRRSRPARLAEDARVAHGSGAHARSLAAAARQAASELLRSGTTTVLTMETVHDTDAVFEALEPMGLRAVVGKCMMDADSAVPSRLMEQTARFDRRERRAWPKRWHGRANGRLRAAFAPRFAVSCSRELLEAVARLSSEHQLVIHTHASENRDEIAPIKSRTGRKNIDYLADTGLTSPRLCRALRVGRRGRAGVDGRAWREGAALPRLEPEARFRGSRRSWKCARSDLGLARAPTARRATTTSTCSRRCGWPRCCRRCAPAGRADRRATRLRWRPARAPARSASNRRSAASKSASAPTSVLIDARGRILSDHRLRQPWLPTSGRRSSTARCWSTISGRSDGIPRKSRPPPGRKRRRCGAARPLPARRPRLGNLFMFGIVYYVVARHIVRRHMTTLKRDPFPFLPMTPAAFHAAGAGRRSQARLPDFSKMSKSAPPATSV